ncbi:MAG: tyrosine-protein phosphatase, partial [Planctomycetes bacterium]|nr:tyrosine-protein phosphatase [Planctomycetota bacterium]
MQKLLPWILGPLLVVSMIAAPLGYYRWRDREFRNFHVVEEGVLYRSGQLPIHRLQELVFARGIRTVICLRKGNDPNDQREEEWIKARGLKFVRIPPPRWYPDADGKTPADDALKTFRAVMDDPANYPVLVHCFAGYHRTGAMCAVYRMDYQGWKN